MTRPTKAQLEQENAELRMLLNVLAPPLEAPPDEAAVLSIPSSDTGGRIPPPPGWSWWGGVEPTCRLSLAGFWSITAMLFQPGISGTLAQRLVHWYPFNRTELIAIEAPTSGRGSSAVGLGQEYVFSYEGNELCYQLAPGFVPCAGEEVQWPPNDLGTQLAKIETRLADIEKRLTKLE